MKRKKTIRLTESKLISYIEKTVNKVLNEQTAQAIEYPDKSVRSSRPQRPIHTYAGGKKFDSRGRPIHSDKNELIKSDLSPKVLAIMGYLYHMARNQVTNKKTIYDLMIKLGETNDVNVIPKGYRKPINNAIGNKENYYTLIHQGKRAEHEFIR